MAKGIQSPGRALGIASLLGVIIFILAVSPLIKELLSASFGVIANYKNRSLF